MAIVRGNTAGGGQQAANLNWNHNNISTGSGILPVFTNVIAAGAVTRVTYAGQDLILKQTYITHAFGTIGEIKLWFLVGPPTGINVVQLTHTGGQGIVGISVDYNGVDQGNPFGTIKGLHQWILNSGPALLSEDLSTANTWMCVDAAVNGRLNAFPLNLIEGAGQTSLNRQSAGALPNNTTSIEVSDEASVGGTTTMSWTGMDNVDHWGHLAAPLRPAVSARGRAVKYFFPFWNAAPKLFDANGKIVSISDIQKDVWVEAQGLGMPTAENPASFIEDPSRSKIIEVNATQVSARIKTNKNQFAEVLVSRVAAGS